MTSNKIIFFRFAFWCGLLILTVLSLLPVENLPPQVLDVWDKAQHAAGFALLTASGLLAYGRHATRLCSGLLVHGGLIELAQSFTGWRYGDWADLLADAIGILMGALLVLMILRARERPQR